MISQVYVLLLKYYPLLSPTTSLKKSFTEFSKNEADYLQRGESKALRRIRSNGRLLML